MSQHDSERRSVIHPEPTVFVVDSDVLSRNAVQDMACRMNLRCRTYSSGLQFLREYDRSSAGCLVCEVRILDIGGLEVQRRLAAEGATLPVVFLSEHASVSVVVRALREGAIHFVEKPFQEDALWEAVQKAVCLDQSRRAALAKKERMRQCLASLTPGEFDVWRLWSSSHPTQSIAERLDISLRTVESRQNSVLRKLGIKTAIELLPVAVRVVDEPPVSAELGGTAAGEARLDRGHGARRLQSTGWHGIGRSNDDVR